MQGSIESGGTGYREIAEELRQNIGSGRIEVGSLLPTERELYSQFGVSRTTIRRALQDLVRSGWAVSQPNRGHIASQPSPARESRLVAFVDHANSIHQSLFFKLSQSLATQGFHLVHIDSEQLGTVGAMERAAAEGMYGAIVWSKTSTPDVHRLQRLKSLLHVVTIMHHLPAVGAAHVQPKLYEGARMAVRHLHRMGYRRPAVTGIMDGFRAHHEGFSGFLAACHELDIHPSPMDFLFCRTSTSQALELRHLERRLKDEDRPDAIVMLQDMWVEPIGQVIAKAGLSVPGDIAVVGMGNDFPYSFSGTDLTTVAYDWSMAAQQIVEQLLQPETSALRHARSRQFDVSLVIRGSAGEPVDQWSNEPYTPNRAIPFLSVPQRSAGRPGTMAVPSTVK